MLEEVAIENYRGFYSKQDAKFAKPNGKPGSGLTLIVGPNNSGKTSLLEALMIDEHKTIKKTERHEAPPRFTFKYDDGEFTFSTIGKGSQVKLENSKVSYGFSHERLHIIPSRRYWIASSNSEHPPGVIIKGSLSQGFRSIDHQGGRADVASVFMHINRNTALKEQVTRLIKRVIKNFNDWDIETDDSGVSYIRYFTSDGKFHNTNFLGDGIISIMRMCVHLIDGEKQALIIDEPELSLHPNSQKALAKILSERSSDQQIIICTHSPHFVNFQDFSNGGALIRLNNINKQGSIISQLNPEDKYLKKIFALAKDGFKPYLLDYVAKELLFYDRVLFVEGQDDAFLIKQYFNDYDIPYEFEIFGYGVGGTDNMELFLQFALALNFQKIVALFDKGTKNFKNLSKEHKDNHKVRIYETETYDIRDKYDRCSECGYEKEIIGLFKSGKLKMDMPEAKTFMEQMNDIKIFLETN